MLEREFRGLGQELGLDFGGLGRGLGVVSERLGLHLERLGPHFGSKVLTQTQPHRTSKKI